MPLGRSLLPSALNASDSDFMQPSEPLEYGLQVRSKMHVCIVVTSMK